MASAVGTAASESIPHDEMDLLPMTASRLSGRLTFAGLITRRTAPTTEPLCSNSAKPAVRSPDELVDARCTVRSTP